MSAARIGVQLLLVATSVVTVVPVLWMVSTSLKSTREYTQNPWFLPQNPRWESYVTLFTQRGFGMYLRNSVMIVVPTVALIVLFASMAAYVLVQRDFRFTKWLLGYFLVGQMIPLTAIIAPLYVTMRAFGLLNTFEGIILAYVAGSLPLSVFLIYGFFRGIPEDLKDSASIDGAGPIRTFISIYLPLGAPGIATVTIFQFLSAWNDILLVLLVLQRNDLQTLNVAVFQVVGEFGTDIPALFAGLTVTAAPVVLVYLVFTRQFVKGLTAGALKG